MKFHNGNPFTADDVVFSAERVLAPSSDLKTRMPADAKVAEGRRPHRRFRAHDARTRSSISEWDTWYIIDKEWAEANNATEPLGRGRPNPSHAARNANGTGPFMVDSHQPGVKTIFKPNPNWWGKPEHNLTEVVFTPIQAPATRVAALLSNAVDMIDPVPIQDIDRVNANPAPPS